MFRQMRWRIAIPYLALIVVTMSGLAVYTSFQMRQAYLDELRTQLGNECALVREAVVASLAPGEAGESMDVLARHYADELGARVTFIRPDGLVLGESHENRAQMDSHLYRPEVQQALSTGRGVSIRFSPTAGHDMMYVAVLTTIEEAPIAVVRLSLPLTQIDAYTFRLQLGVLAATLLATCVAAIIGVLIAERTARPVRALMQVVERVAEGDLDARLLPAVAGEIGTLTKSFNRMADRLRDMIAKSSDETARLAVVLDHMADGVLMTDVEGRVRLISPAALRLLGTTEQAALGSSFVQVARDYRLVEVWQRCREERLEQADQVDLNQRGLLLGIIATPLGVSNPGECLVILQDLTRVRKLETVRRDFVSNVSHELRTPLASLKALAETLRDGAVDDPLAARRFLDRMDTEVDALTRMVEELLELSRVESGQVLFSVAAVPVQEVLLPAVERMRAQAERAGVKLSVELPASLPPVLADSQRIQQVLINLLHNAIKFTTVGGQVAVLARSSGDYVEISVRDTGVGIPSEALPRIFERFYKADRSRSGEGAGLGLAIAKHIVQGHGGQIWVESREGKGSIFHFTLRMAGREGGVEPAPAEL